VGELLLQMVVLRRRELVSGRHLRRMKPRFMCTCARAEEGIIQPIYGRTVDPEDAWCPTSVYTVWTW